MATIKLYDENPYAVSFAAEVVSVTEGRQEGSLDVILDQTLFFPEEGGQTPDLGQLAGHEVLDVQTKDLVITHTLSKEGPEIHAGDRVEGKIDWDHRFSNMQNHSGEHILSGLLHNLYGYENVGFRLSDNTVTLDTSGQLSDEQLLDLTRRANEVVYANLPIQCEYPAPDVLAALEYRSKKEIDGAVRIVTIPGVDACACCAPHVARTGEIGLIKIIGVMHTKNNMRLTIVCGRRALEDTLIKQTEIEKVSHLANEPQTTASAGVQRLLDQITSLKEEVRAMQDAYVESMLSAAEKENPGDLSAMDKWVFEPSLDPLTQRRYMNGLCQMGYRYAGVFVGNDTDGYKYLIGSRSGDAREPGARLKESLQARGGGKPEMVQGSVAASKERILNALV